MNIEIQEVNIKVEEVKIEIEEKESNEKIRIQIAGEKQISRKEILEN